MNPAPINIFQKLMRKWDAVHPYNAAQVMTIHGEPDLPALTAAWQAALAAAGLGRVRTREDRYRFESMNGDGRTLRLALPAKNLSEHLSEELNRPFTDPAEPPFRPFVIREAGHYFAGVVYHHWIADSASIRTLLREWFMRVYDPPAASCRPLKLAVNGYWNTLGPHRGGWQILDSALSLGRRHTRLRRAQKIASNDLSDHRTAFMLFSAPDWLIARLKPWASGRRVKLNDVFLAALAEACARHVPLQRRKNRMDVAVGSIVDLRPHCRDDLSNTFGVFLGFTHVLCRPADLRDFDRLLRVVSNQTRLQKATGVAQSSLMWMSAAMAAGTISRPDELYHSYRKELPLAGGISNVDLSQTWAGQYHPSPLLDYLRVSPSGPMTPLVVTTTTLGERFHVGVTYRTGLVGYERAAAVGNCFLARLGELV
jgi:hypothetical protein